MYAIRSYYEFGHATRYGALVSDTTEAVGGVVMMLKGANANEVIGQVKEKITSIQKSLPEGIEITPYLVITSYSIHYTKLYDQLLVQLEIVQL